MSSVVGPHDLNMKLMRWMILCVILTFVSVQAQNEDRECRKVFQADAVQLPCGPTGISSSQCINIGCCYSSGCYKKTDNLFGILVDEQMLELYVNDMRVTSGGDRDAEHRWYRGTFHKFRSPSDIQLVAIKARLNSTHHTVPFQYGGLLVDSLVLYTLSGYSGWKCVAVGATPGFDRDPPDPRWFTIGYDDTTWPPALKSYDNEHLGVETYFQMNVDAEWIWVQEKEESISKPVYCRGHKFLGAKCVKRGGVCLKSDQQCSHLQLSGLCAEEETCCIKGPYDLTILGGDDPYSLWVDGIFEGTGVNNLTFTFELQPTLVALKIQDNGDPEMGVKVYREDFWSTVVLYNWKCVDQVLLEQINGSENNVWASLNYDDDSWTRASEGNKRYPGGPPWAQWIIAPGATPGDVMYCRGYTNRMISSYDWFQASDGNEYLVSTTALPIEEAFSACQDVASRLAIPYSKTEHITVRGAIKSIIGADDGSGGSDGQEAGEVCRNRYEQSYWIGLSKQRNTKQWIWLDGSNQRVEWSIWIRYPITDDQTQNEPDPNHESAVMDGCYEYLWASSDINDRHPFVCQRPQRDEPNECESEPCQNSATCQDMDGAFACLCPSPYYGQLCELGGETTDEATTTSSDLPETTSTAPEPTSVATTDGVAGQIGEGTSDTGGQDNDGTDGGLGEAADPDDKATFSTTSLIIIGIASISILAAMVVIIVALTYPCKSLDSQQEEDVMKHEAEEQGSQYSGVSKASKGTRKSKSQRSMGSVSRVSGTRSVQTQSVSGRYSFKQSHNKLNTNKTKPADTSYRSLLSNKKSGHSKNPSSTQSTVV